MLNMMEFPISEAMKLAKMRLARGWFWIRYRGMMGRETRDSTMMKAGKKTPKIAREAMTNGCDPKGV